METYGTSPLKTYEIATGKTATPGYLAAMDAAGKVLDAEDAANLTVIGIFKNSDSDAGTAEVDSSDIKSFENDSTEGAAVTRLMRGKPCYVKDGYTVSSSAGSHGVPAGIVVDVIETDVFIDQTPGAMATAAAYKRIAGAVTALTDSTSGTAAATIAAPAGADYTAAEHKNNYASLTVKINSIVSALKAAGLMTN
jgi:hypothetical protein